ncbi:DUF6531 domain-containing protein [Iodobacter arcticus]|uniref:DUF6531 domain-containing protein n=1 Tax=Iodobacter arcticus TaxID=590593 RepID=A0ABW2QSG4_9NEIS
MVSWFYPVCGNGVVGTYNLGSGAKFCDDCPSGSFFDSTSNACKSKCSIGQYLTNTGICSPLSACPINTSCTQPKKSDLDKGLSCPWTGNPISTLSGNKFQEETDFSLANGLSFKRFYNGNDSFDLGVGIGWRHNFMRRVIPVSKSNYMLAPANDVDHGWLAYIGSQTPASGISGYLVEREDGKSFLFDLTGKATTSSFANHYQLTVTNTGFVVADGINTESYDQSGKLTQVVAPNGRILELSYDTNNHLSQVKDNLGSVLTFSYIDGIHASQTQANGLTVASYMYDAGRLSKVTYADNTSRQYLYEDTRNPSLLTGLIDENGQRFASWAYNEQGQAISSEHAGGVDKFTLNFGGDPASGTRWTEETDPLGSVRRYQFKLIAGTWRLQGKDQPGGAGCSAASNNLLYDTNGNVTSRTDFNGNKTTYVYDLARNLETSRTEAAGTPLARTISTEWHATWRLPLKVTEPGRVTSFVYDANANLLNKAITADGQTRRWSWTYADFGQVKTSTDPDGKTSSYQYDAQGNVTALTNPAQQITQFTRYDANGNPLEILSPDGIKSTLTYDARNRLISRQVGAALSRFDYWPTGLLKQATLPDGLVINYLYDAAHRLSEITDNQGHREVYTLNKAGLQEQVDRYDPDSTLANGLLQVQQAQSVKPAK